MNKINGSSQYKRLGLVLGGGGAKGLAHIGVLKVLCDNGIPISYISGCSMGGLIGSLFAYGIPVDQMIAAASRFSSIREMVKLIDRIPSRRGLLVGNKVRQFLSQYISQDARLEDSEIPLVLNAVDLITGKEIELNEGPFLDCIMASCAVPGFFPAVDIDAFRLIDGGTLDDVPIRLLRDKPVDFVLAIDVHGNDHGSIIVENDHHIAHLNIHAPEFIRDFYRATMIMTSALIQLNLEAFPPDILVQPEIPKDVSLFWGFQKVNEVIMAGEKAMQSVLPELVEKLSL